MRLPHSASNWLHKNFASMKHRALEFRAAAYTRQHVSRVPIRLRESNSTAVSLIHISKNSHGRFEVEMDKNWAKSKGGFSTIWRRIGVFVDYLSAKATPQGIWKADLGDWVQDDGPVAGFCSAHSRSLLIPDRGFLYSAGYAKQRQLAAQGPDWSKRKSGIVWRGTASGSGIYTTSQMDWQDEKLLQRVRLCLLSQQLQRMDSTLPVDCAITRIPHQDNLAAERLHKAGVVGDRVPGHSWLNNQFAIDIDGNANAFTNFFIRLLFGCCVLKVASPRNFRQWYYDRLKPWVHFIPIAADLSDFETRIRWCFDHPQRCRDIARAGQSLAFSMDHHHERQRAIETLATATI